MLRRSVFRGWTAVLILAAVSWMQSTVYAQGNGKGNGNGGGGDDGGTTDPPSAPVSYSLETIAVEGFSPSHYDVNDRGELLFAVNNADVTQVDIVSDAITSAGVVDINTGIVHYIDDRLTEPTIWTERREGVDSVQFSPYKINNDGDIIGNVHERVGGEFQPSEAYYLKKMSDPTGKVVYQPISFGPVTQALLLNDRGDTFGAELGAQQQVLEQIRLADGSKIFLDDFFGPNYGISGCGLNNVGTFCGRTTIETETGHTELNFLLNTASQVITPIEGLNWIEDWPTNSLNDHDVVAGLARIFYEYKSRGKIRTASYRVPAIVDPQLGRQLFDNPTRRDFQSATINHQRLLGESALLAYSNSYDRQVWLKLPGFDPFFAYDALSTEDVALWSTFEGRGSWARLLTPRHADGTVDQNALPTATGIAQFTGSDGIRVFPGFWVLRPTP